jgi:hypothetical protein
MMKNNRFHDYFCMCCRKFPGINQFKKKRKVNINNRLIFINLSIGDILCEKCYSLHFRTPEQKLGKSCDESKYTYKNIENSQGMKKYGFYNFLTFTLS